MRGFLPTLTLFANLPSEKILDSYPLEVFSRLLSRFACHTSHPAPYTLLNVNVFPTFCNKDDFEELVRKYADHRRQHSLLLDLTKPEFFNER